MDDSAASLVSFWMCSQLNSSMKKVTTMSTAAIHGRRSLDALVKCAVAPGSPDDAARSRPGRGAAVLLAEDG